MPSYRSAVGNAPRIANLGGRFTNRLLSLATAVSRLIGCIKQSTKTEMEKFHTPEAYSRRHQPVPIIPAMHPYLAIVDGNMVTSPATTS